VPARPLGSSAKIARVEIPAGVDDAVSREVARQLEAELGARGLLLDTRRLAEAEAEAAARGGQLLIRVIELCYPASRRSGRALTLDVGGDENMLRLGAALAFGAATARVLVPDREPEGELICALFNLGIGLVDALCDEDPELGVAFLELVHDRDQRDAAQEPRQSGWLRDGLPQRLADDPTASFTALVVEAFFELLHATYPGAARLDLRRGVGEQLEAALEAERRTVAGRTGELTREQSIESSRLTSVLPFQIIETLAAGDRTRAEPSAATRLGEAMWRIDDLVDLTQDAQRGTLNGVLLAAGTAEPLAALERLLTSTDIARAAGEAAESLSAGVTQAGAAGDRATSFLYFIQRYAGIAPRS
jgi:hypothetical protein